MSELSSEVVEIVSEVSEVVSSSPDYLRNIYYMIIFFGCLICLILLLKR